MSNDQNKNDVPENLPDDDRADGALAADQDAKGVDAQPVPDKDSGLDPADPGTVSDPGNSGGFTLSGEVAGQADKPNG